MTHNQVILYVEQRRAKLIEELTKQETEWRNKFRELSFPEYIIDTIFQQTKKYELPEFDMIRPYLPSDLDRKFDAWHTCGEMVYEYMDHDMAYKNDGWYLEDQSMNFDGDIIITDPCYLCEDNDKLDTFNMNDHCHIMSETLYGDWSCTVFDCNTKQPIGEFCADGGMVGVYSLDTVLAAFPEFDYHIKRKWTTTWIKDFKGTVEIKIEKRNDEFECYVEGHGIDKKTGKPIDFVSRQTGF